ncbi:glycosyltransferase family 1 protein [Actinoplanes sp. DH11]|uniref:glycosyltransferase family 4 protein n=1 Tax=Actinoplanes sp. DH11 TaxID=2857011 RepID=UPI001E64C977|nr:glycosyltransferase family 1 protein [Actinoplanes sp. DH11]
MTEVNRRIWINGRWTSQRITGTQRYAAEMMRAMDPADAARCVVALPADADPPPWLTERFTCVRSRFSGMFFEQVWLPLRSWGHTLISMSGPAPVLKRRQVVVMHDASVRRIPEAFSTGFRLWYEALYRLISRGPARLVTVSEFSAGEVADWLGVPADRFHVVPCGAEHVDDIVPDASIADRLPDAPFALTVGSRAPHKRTALVVDQFTATGAHLVVVGAAPSARVLRTDMPEAHTEHAGNIHYLGRVTDAELAYLYRHAGALLMPSVYEGFGIPVVEAQRLGCPVICAGNASLPEVAGDAAIMVSDRGERTYAAEFAVLSNDSPARARLRERGAANARRYSWRDGARRLLDLARSR